MSREFEGRFAACTPLLVVAALMTAGVEWSPAHAWSIGGLSGSNFSKSPETCYQCGGTDRSENADSTPALPPPDPGEVERQALITEMNYAWAQKDIRGAIEIVYKILALRDDDQLRRWAQRAQSHLVIDDADALLAKGDKAGALSLYYRALSIWPDVYTSDGRRRLVELEQSIQLDEQKDARARGAATKRLQFGRQAQRANDEALAKLEQGKWWEALDSYVKMGVDRTSPEMAAYPKIAANWLVAEAAVARFGRGDLSDAIRKLQEAAILDGSNATAERMLRIALAEREKTGRPMQSAVTAVTNDPRVVDARGPKPLAELIATIPELAESSSAERARKGLVAAANHDWVLARAWYKDALNHDPGNPTLKRAVDLAEWMVQRRTSSKPAGSATISDAAMSPEQLVKLYEQIVRQVVADGFRDDYDRAKAAYFSHQLRKQADNASAYGETVKRQKVPSASEAPLDFIKK